MVTSAQSRDTHSCGPCALAALECMLRRLLLDSFDQWDELTYRMLMTWSVFYAGVHDEKPPIHMPVPHFQYSVPFTAAMRKQAIALVRGVE